MIELPIYNQAGQEIDKVQVDPALLGGEVRPALLKQAVLMYQANLRQGTVRTRARGEVVGSTKKLFRQKGTGNARQGSIRQPVRVGGGHAKQKRPKDWSWTMPQKSRRLARDSAILAKLESKDVRVVDRVTLEPLKTKTVAGMLKALKVERTCLVAIAAPDPIFSRCVRNLPKATLTTVSKLNAWDVLRNRTLLITREGLDQLLAKKA